jgi:hypothetical protein
MEDREMYCATCRREALFDAPPCPDGHDDDCPELVCTGCGTAVLVAPIVGIAWLRPGGGPGRARVAPQQRRAA